MKTKQGFYCELLSSFLCIRKRPLLCIRPHTQGYMIYINVFYINNSSFRYMLLDGPICLKLNPAISNSIMS